jgi:ribosomal protein S18 acetylase RimI-like enzyme
VRAVRPLTGGDEPALAAFLDALPPGDRTFIKEEVTDPEVPHAWVEDRATFRAVAVDDGAILGLVAVSPGVGWSSHVGELRLVVHPAHRRLGLGTEMAREAVLAAVRMGLRKLVVEVVAEQQAAVAMFMGLGFEAEALLRDQIRDRAGELRDVLVLAHRFEDDWSGLATLGLDA